MNKPLLSSSRVGLYQKCGLAWDFRYNKGIKSPPGVALHVGKATHQSVELNLRGKIEGIAVPLDEARELAGSALVEMWKKEPPMLTDEDGSPDKARGAAQDKAVALAGLHHTEVAPGIEPAAVEEGFIIELPGPYDIQGFKDIRATDNAIRDTKTASKSPGSEAAIQSDQLALYAWDAELAGRPAPYVALDYLVATKTPKAVSLMANPGPEEFRRVADRFSAAWKGMAAGVALPAPRDSWMCSAKFCGYFAMCPHGAKNATMVPLSNLTAKHKEHTR